MTDIDEMQVRLKAIAEVVNSFKSESVQLRVVDLLLSQLGVSAAQSADPPPETPKRPKRKKASAKAASRANEPGATQTRKPSRGASSPGAFAMITQLLGDGFFKAPKTIGAIVAHCRTSKGHHYKANECSPSLLRLLRDGKLKREKNKEGQYEYTQA